MLDREWSADKHSTIERGITVFNSADNSGVFSNSQEQSSNKESIKWLTNVELGEDLLPYYDLVKDFQTRDCFKEIKAFLAAPTEACVCALFGLRRTGKTTMLYQVIAQSDINSVAYIKVFPGDTIANIQRDLSSLLELGIKIVLIDEITFATDFAAASNLLADHYAIHGMKIILSGTDSLGFLLAKRRPLYARIKLIHTTFISFQEFSRLLNIYDLDTYIMYGGTLMPEGKIPFRNTAETKEYFNSAIVNNIQHVFDVLYEYPDFYTALKQVYYNDQFANLTNRLVNGVKHRFIVKVFNSRFKSSNLGVLNFNISRQAARDPIQYKKLSDFIAATYDKVLQAYANILCVVSNYKFSTAEIDELQGYLYDLDFISYYRVESPDTVSNQTIFTQPGMQYAQATELIEVYRNIPEYKSLSSADMRILASFIKTNILGCIFEDIIINHTKLALGVKYQFEDPYDIFKYQFNDGEFDMVVIDRDGDASYLFEIKHSAEKDIHQVKHLCNAQVVSSFSYHYGEVARKTVLYTGSTEDIKVVHTKEEIAFADDYEVEALAGMETEIIHYQNIVEYLNSISEFYNK